jgi:hypothetical protein
MNVGKRDPVSPEDAEKGRKLSEWRALYPEAWGYELDWDEDLGVAYPSHRPEAATTCGARMGNGEHCGWMAGSSTAHVGVGRCVRHDSQVERAAGAWTVAHAIARIQDISPWDALLLAVRRAAAWAAFYDSKLAEATDDDQLRPNGSHYDWVRAAERVNDKLARYSKMAVDAGVAQLMVQRARAEGEDIARVLNTAIGEAMLDEATEARLRAALRVALTAMDSGNPTGLMAGIEEATVVDDEAV